MRPTFLPILAALIFFVGCTSQQPSVAESTIIAQDGSTVLLDARKIQWNVDEKTYPMYGYNGIIPGPTLRVQQNSTITIEFTNNLPEETTIHWHGLRHDYRNDGVPGVSQEPVKPGERFTYTLHFPDAGVFWYHPHVREDRQQDLGLYGAIIVEPAEQVFDPVREELVVLDDILIENGKIVPYGEEHANFALMGRFGNTMLVNGKIAYQLEVQQGEIVELLFVNVANARPFNISIPGAQLTLVGGDIGGYEQPQLVENIVLGPAERAIVDVHFPDAGTYALMHTNLWAQYELGEVIVTPEGDASGKALSKPVPDIGLYRGYFDKPIDAEVLLDLDVPHAMMQGMMQQTMGMSGEMHSVTPIEWEDTMLMMNQMMDTQLVKWVMRDKASGNENDELTYNWEAGTVKKIRLTNLKDSEHPMQHLMHLHGQRFLVLSVDGKPNDHLVWKDTVMVPAGATVDILVDASNPGTWMFHCHIAEHLEAGMMSMVIVG